MSAVLDTNAIEEKKDPSPASDPSTSTDNTAAAPQDLKESTTDTKEKEEEKEVSELPPPQDNKENGNDKKEEPVAVVEEIKEKENTKKEEPVAAVKETKEKENKKDEEPVAVVEETKEKENMTDEEPVAVVEETKEDEKESESTDSKTEDDKKEDKPVVDEKEKIEEGKPTDDENKEEKEFEKREDIKEDEESSETKSSDEKKEEEEVEDKEDDSAMDVDEPVKEEEDAIETEDDTPTKKEESEEDEDTPMKTPMKGVRNSLQDFLVTPGSNQSKASGKRVRKSVERHEPGNLKAKPVKETRVGRGEKLSDIPSVQTLVSKRVRTDTVLKDAHRLLYGFGKKRIAAPKVTVIKNAILDYSGFLYADSTPEEDATRMEKYKAFAMKVNLPSLREICDLFDIDRSQVAKETIVDRLANFLSIPDQKYTKTYVKASSKKKSAPPEPITKKRKTVTTPSKGTKRRKKTEKSDVTESKEDDTPDPTEDQLREWVHHYVNCFDLDKATTKHAIETVSDKFGKNLGHKKQLIKEFLADELNKM